MRILISGIITCGILTAQSSAPGSVAEKHTASPVPISVTSSRDLDYLTLRVGIAQEAIAKINNLIIGPLKVEHDALVERICKESGLESGCVIDEVSRTASPPRSKRPDFPVEKSPPPPRPPISENEVPPAPAKSPTK